MIKTTLINLHEKLSFNSKGLGNVFDLDVLDFHDQRSYLQLKKTSPQELTTEEKEHNNIHSKRG